MPAARQQHQRIAETELPESGVAAWTVPPIPSSDSIATTPTNVLRARLMTTFLSYPGYPERHLTRTCQHLATCGRIPVGSVARRESTADPPKRAVGVSKCTARKCVGPACPLPPGALVGPRAVGLNTRSRAPQGQCAAAATRSPVVERNLEHGAINPANSPCRSRHRWDGSHRVTHRLPRRRGLDVMPRHVGRDERRSLTRFPGHGRCFDRAAGSAVL